MIFVIAFLAGAIVVTNFLLATAKANAATSITENQAKVANFNTVQTKATQFRTNLSKAKSLLDSDIKYSKIIVATANLLPDGSILDTLQLDESSFGKTMVLSVKVRGESQALALRDAFQSSSLYTNISYGKLTTNADADTVAYPYTIELNVTMNKAAAQ